MNERPTHAPPLLLKIVAANLSLWLIVVPIVLAIRLDLSPEWITFAFCGVPLVGAGLLVLFISRWAAYGYYVLFWYWQGLIALIGIAVGGLAIMVIIFEPGLIPVRLQTITIADGWLPGAAVGAMITLAVVVIGWKVWRGIKREPPAQPVITAPPPPEPPPVRKELTYLQDRQSRR